MNASISFAHEQRNRWLRDFAVEDQLTMDVLAACPDGNLFWRPSEKCAAFAPLLLHIYRTGPWFMRIIRGLPVESNEIPGTLPTKRAAIRAECAQHHAELIGRLRDLPIEKLTAQINYFDYGEYQGVTLLEWHFRHWIHHRGQLQLYLRLMGAQCPPIYGPTLEDALAEPGDS